MMYTCSLYFVIQRLLLLVFIPTAVHAVLFGEQCNSNSDCTDVNTQCTKFLACEIGTCQCVSGYGNANSDGCEKKLVKYHESCGSDSYCSDTQQTCNVTAGRCECATWYTYHVLEKGCVLMERKLLTETCGGWWLEECLIQTSDGFCDATCQCTDGYTMDLTETYTACRAPRYGERCLSSPLCTTTLDTKTISDDGSSTTPRCYDNTCGCPASHEYKRVNGHDLCLNKVTAATELLENGETCTHFNECESSLCVKCPGSSSGVCMQGIIEGLSGGASYLETPRRLMLAGFLTFMASVLH